MPRVIVLDPLSEDGLKLLKAAGNTSSSRFAPELSGEDLKKAAAEVDGAICRSGVKITAQALAGRRLKAIARAGVGTDNIDKEAATRLGIVVMNTPGGNTISTAEQTIALMLAASREISIPPIRV